MSRGKNPLKPSIKDSEGDQALRFLQMFTEFLKGFGAPYTVKATAAKGSAPARTRQIKIANAVDLDRGRYATKSISSFLYPIQAVSTVLDKTSLARIDLAAISDQRTVKPEKVNQLKDGEYDPDLELLSEALKWCWSGSAEIRFTEEAVKTLLDAATRLYRAFHSPSIPLVDMNMKWKLARLSAALAFMTLSASPEFDAVTVTREHVEEVVAFIEREYTEAGLNALARGEEYDVLTAEDAVSLIGQVASAIYESVDKAVAIVKWIPLQGGVTRSQIMEKFSLAERNELRPLLAMLQNEGLIRASGRGFTPLPKLIQLYKLLEGPEASEIIQMAKVEAEPQSEAGQVSLNDIGGSDSEVGRIGSLGNEGQDFYPSAKSAESTKARERPPNTIEEPRDEIERYVVRTADRHADIGYIRLKDMLEYRFNTKLAIPDFEKLLTSMEGRGLIEYDGVTVKRRRDR